MSRVERLQNKFDQLKIDAFLVSDGANLQYLTGMVDMAGDGYLLVLAQEAYLITDARYQTAFAGQYDGQHLVITRDYLGAVCDIIAKTGTGVMGFEAEIPYTWSMSCASPRVLMRLTGYERVHVWRMLVSNT